MIPIDDRQELDQLLRDRSIKTLAIVHGADAASTALANRVDGRTKAFNFREVGLVRGTGILTAREEEAWFGAADARGVVLASVPAGRPVVDTMPADATLTEIEEILLRSDAVRP